MALLTSCGVRLYSRVGVLSRGVADLGVPGTEDVGDVTRDEAQLEDAPLRYPLVLDVPIDMVEIRPVSVLIGAGSNS